MTWSSRPHRAPHRPARNPYPIRFVAVCGQGDLRMGAYDLHVAEGAADWHQNATGHESVEVVRAEEVE